MRIEKRFKAVESVNGKCAKELLTVEHNNVIYTVVYDKLAYKPDQKLRIYWNTGWNTGWTKEDHDAHKHISKVPSLQPSHESVDVADVTRFAWEELSGAVSESHDS